MDSRWFDRFSSFFTVSPCTPCAWRSVVATLARDSYKNIHVAGEPRAVETYARASPN